MAEWEPPKPLLEKSINTGKITLAKTVKINFFGILEVSKRLSTSLWVFIQEKQLTLSKNSKRHHIYKFPIGLLLPHIHSSLEPAALEQQ